MVLHPLTDDRRILPIERTGETLQASPEFMLVVSYSPGYQNLLKGMKPSTRQRFVAKRFDFPEPGLEVEILQGESGIDVALASRIPGMPSSRHAIWVCSRSVSRWTSRLANTCRICLAAAVMWSFTAPRSCPGNCRCYTPV